MEDIAGNLKRVREEIADAALRCGRQPAEVKLLAVTKTFPPEAVREAARCGQTLFGENRVQEAEAKIPALAAPTLRWHLIGHLQSNKAARAVELFDAVQSLDSPKLAAKVGRAAQERAKDLPVFIQVNIGEEPQKHGVLAGQLDEMIAAVEEFPRLKLQGLMAIPPLQDDPRPHFRRLRRLLEKANQGRCRPLTELSMGMSGDWQVAVAEGATLLRIGSAIFGQRS